MRLLHASAAQHVHDRVVPLVAGVLEQVARSHPPPRLVRRHREADGPRPGEADRVGDRRLLTRERIQQVEAAALRKLRDPQLSPPAQLVRPSRVSDAARVERVSLRPGPGGQCCRARGTDRNWTRVDRKMMLWSPAASSSQQRARVRHRDAQGTDVKARASLRPRSAGLTALTPAPRTLVQTGSCRRCSLIHPLHVVVDVPSRMTLFRATADSQAAPSPSV